MAFPIVGAIAAGAGILNAISAGRSAARRRRELARKIAEFRAARAQGYNTPEDLREAELTRGRLGAAAARRTQQAGFDVLNRFRARGLRGSPAEERALGRLAEEEARARESAGDVAENALYNTRLGRESFEQNKILAAFNAEMGLGANDQRREDLANATFQNSLLEITPSLASFYGGGTAATGAPTMGQPGFVYPVAGVESKLELPK